MAGQSIGDAGGSRVAVYTAIVPFGQATALTSGGGSLTFGINQTDPSVTNPSKVTAGVPQAGSIAAMSAASWGAVASAGSLTFTVTGASVGAAPLVINANGSLTNWYTNFNPGAYAFPAKTPWTVVATVTGATAWAQSSGGICIRVWAYINFI